MLAAAKTPQDFQKILEEGSLYIYIYIYFTIIKEKEEKRTLNIKAINVMKIII